MIDTSQENRTVQQGGVEAEDAGNISLFKVKTTRFGEIEVDSERIISMTTPVLGFPESRRYVLRPHAPESPFLWLQSLENPGLAFVVIHSGLVDASYAPPISEDDRQELELAVGKNPEFLLILTLSREGNLKITANLMGPLALNAEKRFAKQILLDPAKYDIAFPLE